LAFLFGPFGCIIAALLPTRRRPASDEKRPPIPELLQELEHETEVRRLRAVRAARLKAEEEERQRRAQKEEERRQRRAQNREATRQWLAKVVARVLTVRDQKEEKDATEEELTEWEVIERKWADAENRYLRAQREKNKAIVFGSANTFFALMCGCVEWKFVLLIAFCFNSVAWYAMNQPIALGFIHFKCRKCGNQFHVQKNWAGDEWTCQVCSNTQVIPRCSTATPDLHDFPEYR
jgi:ribosomal protein S27E